MSENRKEKPTLDAIRPQVAAERRKPSSVRRDFDAIKRESAKLATGEAGTLRVGESAPFGQFFQVLEERADYILGSPYDGTNTAAAVVALAKPPTARGGETGIWAVGSGVSAMRNIQGGTAAKTETGERIPWQIVAPPASTSPGGLPFDPSLGREFWIWFRADHDLAQAPDPYSLPGLPVQFRSGQWHGATLFETDVRFPDGSIYDLWTRGQDWGFTDENGNPILGIPPPELPPDPDWAHMVKVSAFPQYPMALASRALKYWQIPGNDGKPELKTDSQGTQYWDNLPYYFGSVIGPWFRFSESGAETALVDPPRKPWPHATPWSSAGRDQYPEGSWVTYSWARQFFESDLIWDDQLQASAGAWVTHGGDTPRPSDVWLLRLPEKIDPGLYDFTILGRRFLGGSGYTDLDAPAAVIKVTIGTGLRPFGGQILAELDFAFDIPPLYSRPDEILYPWQMITHTANLARPSVHPPEGPQ